MKRHVVIVGAVLLSTTVAVAQGKDDFLRNQAYVEMQRVSGQIDVLQSNFEDLSRRLGKLEGGAGKEQGIHQEIEALKVAISELRREMQAQRNDIVKDLAGRISKIQAMSAPKSQPKPAYDGPCKEYTVCSGDTLSLIAGAFNTTVSKLKDMNNLKSDVLRVGQKLLVPKN